MNIGTGIDMARSRQVPNMLYGFADMTFRPIATLATIGAHNQRNQWRGLGKLILMSTIAVLVVSGSAQAQKKVGLIGPPIRDSISIEDVATGNFLVFVPSSGEYKFSRCTDGLTLSGKGLVRVDGCSISLESEPSDHRVVASVNECTQEGQVLVEQGTTDLFKIYFTDQNIGNNLLTCATTKQGLSIEDDVTGGFFEFDKGTGAYTYTRCSDGFTLSGVGIVKADGCSIHLEDVQADHRVVASVDECTREAKAIVEQFGPKPSIVSVNDQNTGNNALLCATSKAKKNLSGVAD